MGSSHSKPSRHGKSKRSKPISKRNISYPKPDPHYGQSYTKRQPHPPLTYPKVHYRNPGPPPPPPASSKRAAPPSKKVNFKLQPAPVPKHKLDHFVAPGILPPSGMTHKRAPAPPPPAAIPRVPKGSNKPLPRERANPDVTFTRILEPKVRPRARPGRMDVAPATTFSAIPGIRRGQIIGAGDKGARERERDRWDWERTGGIWGSERPFSVKKKQVRGRYMWVGR